MKKLGQPSRWLVVAAVVVGPGWFAACGPAAYESGTNRSSPAETAQSSVESVPELTKVPVTQPVEPALGSSEGPITQPVAPALDSTEAPITQPVVAASESTPGRDSAGLPVEGDRGPVYYPREDTTYPEALVQQARQDLAQRFNASPDSVEVVNVEAVTWPDASLGGVRDGALQVLTPGFRIVLVLGGTHYAYHTALADEENVLFYGAVVAPVP